MKTQLLKTIIINAALAIMIIAATAPQAGAQRREQNNEKQKVEKADKQAEKNNDNHAKSKEYCRPAKPGIEYRSHDQQANDRAYRREKNNHEDPKANRRENRHEEDRWNKPGHPEWDRDHRPDFHPDVRHHDDRDYCWHRHHDISFRHLPRKAVWVHIDGVDYALYRGKFYIPGPLGFYRIFPPVYLQTLPEECFRVMIDNRLGWNFHGILLVETPLGFKIIV
ncbi:MAG TPA: hypothetical protein PKH79_10105 [Prolixibacteraceae bacterium]|nr:hypothetical protein [Prolixibacteraceae bacterium]HPS12627.1 hypothetical protein [Prolixibacteraceae bacterium]